MSGLTLGISISDVFTNVSELFTTFWPILAAGIAIIIMPRFFGLVRSAFPSAGKR